MWVVALVRDRVTEMQITPDKDKLLLLWFMIVVKGCIIQTSTNAILLCFFFCYSATWPKGVQRMADQYLKNPVRVFVGSLDLNVSKL